MKAVISLPAAIFPVAAHLLLLVHDLAEVMVTHPMPQDLNGLILTAPGRHIHYVLILCHCPSQREASFLVVQRDNCILENKTLKLNGMHYGDIHINDKITYAHIYHSAIK